MKHVGDGEQSLMFVGILSSQYSPKGKATAGMGIVGYGDGVGLTIIVDGVYARHFITAYGVYTQFVGFIVLRTTESAIGSQ